VKSYATKTHDDALLVPLAGAAAEFVVGVFHSEIMKKFAQRQPHSGSRIVKIAL
jgi:hypothetical protein